MHFTNSCVMVINKSEMTQFFLSGVLKGQDLEI